MMSETKILNTEFDKRGKRDGSKKQEINNQYDQSYNNLRNYLIEYKIKKRLEEISEWYNGKTLQLDLLQKEANLSVVEHFEQHHPNPSSQLEFFRWKAVYLFAVNDAFKLRIKISLCPEGVNKGKYTYSITEGFVREPDDRDSDYWITDHQRLVKKGVIEEEAFEFIRFYLIDQIQKEMSAMKFS